jgi:hypothetical protein
MFKSFFSAGFDCTDALTARGVRLNHIHATQHDRFLETDYQLLRDSGIYTVREGLSWSRTDRNGQYDFSHLERLIEASKRYGIEVIFDMCHFGYPDDIDALSDEFIKRFADYCYSAARFITERIDTLCSFTPINEPSYFAWIGGEEGAFAPFLKGLSFEFKVNLVRASIAGNLAIWAASPATRIVNIDPICRSVAPFDRPDLETHADSFNNEAVFQSWDMLCGRLLPELGGNMMHLGVMGINYYWTNQWEWGNALQPLQEDDPRCWTLSQLVSYVWKRYRADLIIGETSHIGSMRARWLRHVVAEAESLLEAGVSLQGICLYPVLGMPSWTARTKHLKMGLWDLKRSNSSLVRVPYSPMLNALSEAQRLIKYAITRAAAKSER